MGKVGNLNVYTKFKYFTKKEEITIKYLQEPHPLFTNLKWTKEKNV